MSLDPLALVAILGMAAVTFVTRVSGYWLVSRFALRGRLAAGLEAIPGAVLLSVIAPTVLATGPAESLAAVITFVVARRAPMLAAVAAGVTSVVALRYLGL